MPMCMFTYFYVYQHVCMQGMDIPLKPGVKLMAGCNSAGVGVTSVPVVNS